MGDIYDTGSIKTFEGHRKAKIASKGFSSCYVSHSLYEIGRVRYCSTSWYDVIMEIYKHLNDRARLENDITRPHSMAVNF